MTLPIEFGRLIGAQLPETESAAPREDQLTVMLDWALHWTRRGLCVFPAKPLIGTPILVKHWYSCATSNTAQIVQWWAERPDADIGCVPGKAGYFVIAAIEREGGLESLQEIEKEFGPLAPDIDTDNNHNDRFLWFKGCAPSNYQGVGDGLYVLGAGHYVFLPPSLAPAPAGAWQIKGER
jgi:hypothetical protein